MCMFGCQADALLSHACACMYTDALIAHAHAEECMYMATCFACSRIRECIHLLSLTTHASMRPPLAHICVQFLACCVVLAAHIWKYLVPSPSILTHAYHPSVVVVIIYSCMPTISPIKLIWPASLPFNWNVPHCL